MSRNCFLLTVAATDSLHPARSGRRPPYSGCRCLSYDFDLYLSV